MARELHVGIVPIASDRCGARLPSSTRGRENQHESAAFLLTLNHTMAVDDPLELFPTHTAMIG